MDSWCKHTDGGHSRHIFIAVLAALHILQSEGAVVAYNQYSMDLKSDCIATGFLDVLRDQKIYVRGSSQPITSAPTLSCRLQFSPQTEGDSLLVSLEPGAYINDCDVSLEMEMLNVNPNGNPISYGPGGIILRDGKYILGCKSDLKSTPKLEAVNGRISLWLSRRQYEDTDYGFQISVTALRTVGKVTPGSDANTSDAGMIAGIVIGVILLLVIAIIICVCCYRKRKTNQEEKAKKDLSLSNGAGQDPAAPGSGRRLLDKEYDDSGKLKSALDRFGPTPVQRTQLNAEVKERELEQRRNEGIENGRRRDNYEEREMRKPQDGDDEREGKKPIASTRQGPPNAPLLIDLQNNPKFRRSLLESDDSDQNTPKSPLLAALQSNHKFRKSFHENEADADERARRISDYTSSNSSGSLNSVGQSVAKPKLPPVPKSPPRSPSPQRRGEKIAGIHRARPSSSSSDLVKFDEDETDDRKDDHNKNNTRHTLRPKREEKKPERKTKEGKRRNQRSDDDDSDDRSRDSRERDRKDEERRRRRQREKEEEEDRQRKKKEKERKQRREEQKSRAEDEEDEKQREMEHEGRFKKSASGRKSKGKGQRMARSRSTGNAIDDMEPGQSYPKPPGSVRSLNTATDDIDDLDSNYMPFRRFGSKTSLYASRSSLYGRKRKNSMGETMSMSSYVYDDVDSRIGDFDKPNLTHKEKERMFKSTGDLEMRPASALVVRECGTQTGNDKGVYIYGRKTLAKSRPGKRYSRGTQTTRGRERRDSTGSARSGRSTKSNPRLKSRSKSQESLRNKKRSRSRDFSEDDSGSERSSRRHGRSKSRDGESRRRHHHRSKSSDLKDSDSESESYNGKSKPRPKPRKSTGPASIDYSGSDHESEDNKSALNSSATPSSVIHAPSQQMPYGPQSQYMPAGYPVVYPQPGFSYISTAPGGPPVMVLGPVQPPKPEAAPKPSGSKWDQLVNLTDGMKQRRHQMGESVTEIAETESVWSHSHSAHPQVYYVPSEAKRLPELSTTYSTYPESSHKGSKGFEHGSFYAPSDSIV